MSADDLLLESFNISIVEELIREINPNATEETIQQVWESCQGNPWNAPILYQLINIT